MSDEMGKTVGAAESKPAPLGQYVKAISDVTRWKILAALAEGEPLMVTELSARVERDQSTVSKHLAIMRGAGMVEQGRARLYCIPARWVKDAATGVMDFGHGSIQFRKPVAGETAGGG